MAFWLCALRLERKAGTGVTCVELCEGGFTIPELVPKWEVDARIGKGADVVVGTKVGFLQRKLVMLD